MERECVTFTYQRFAHHAIAEHMLQQASGPDEVVTMFGEGGEFHHLLSDEISCYQYAGLVEALAIGLPEKWQLEIAELRPDIWEWRPVKEAFRESLTWRQPRTIGEKAIEYFTDLLNDGRYSFAALDQFIALAIRPGHPLNADALHRCLWRVPMPNRDAWWSYYLHRRWNSDATPERLIWWAESEPSDTWSDEVARLCAIGLGWFLATPNRFVRDRATKALVHLLRTRLPTLLELLKLFNEVDDPYVRERLFCVAYGCAMMGENVSEVAELAQWVYETEFQNDSPTPHIMLRDYARGVVETAANRTGDRDSWDLTKIRPPYVSEWPLKIPSQDETNAYNRNDYDDIWSSVLGWGDFARYVMGAERDDAHVRGFGFSGDAARRWVFQRVLDLGWTPERFAAINESISRCSHWREIRTNHKPERFGKKYQWIAWHELLARLVDNCAWERRPYDESENEYRGPWQFFLRDIDASLLRVGGTGQDTRGHCEWWFADSDPLGPSRHQPAQDWVRDERDWPDRYALLRPLDPGSDTPWLCLHSYVYHWREGDGGISSGRQVWYHIYSWIAEQDHVEALLPWLKSQCIWDSGGLRLPIPGESYTAFMGEYPWAPAFASEDHEWISEWGWDEKLLHPVVLTAHSYHWERGYDCSMDDSVHGWIPSPYLVRTFDLRWTGRRL